jgi:hypothetical protein
MKCYYAGLIFEIFPECNKRMKRTVNDLIRFSLHFLRVELTKTITIDYDYRFATLPIVSRRTKL